VPRIAYQPLLGRELVAEALLDGLLGLQELVELVERREPLGLKLPQGRDGLELLDVLLVRGLDLLERQHAGESLARSCRKVASASRPKILSSRLTEPEVPRRPEDGPEESPVEGLQ